MAWGGSGGQVDQIQKRSKRKNRKIFARESTRPADLEKINVFSNKDKNNSVSLVNALVRLEYHESILQDSIRCVLTYTDTGNSTNNQKTGTNCKNTTTAVDGLPITGSETVHLKVKDRQGSVLDLDMRVNKVTNINSTTVQSDWQLELCSPEYLRNEKTHIQECFKGKISQHVDKLLTTSKYLATKKNIRIEPTGAKNYNFIGNNNKPFYAINNLCVKAVPQTPQSYGNTAGFFFFETSIAYYFKSIDKLMAQKPSISIVYTGTPGDFIPKGYNVKALEYTEDISINVQNKLMMGAFTTGCLTFNQRTCDFKIDYLDAEDQEKYYELAGENQNIWNPELSKKGVGFKEAATSRLTFLTEDDGTLPDGETTEQQIEESKEKNFDPSRVFNQAIMRYNSMFAATSTVTIPGDFSVHAGDIVFLDSPQLKANTKSDEVNKNMGGKYLVSDLAHLITPGGTWTKLNLVRDSFGRKGKPTEEEVNKANVVPLTDTSIPGDYDYKDANIVGGQRGGIPLSGV